MITDRKGMVISLLGILIAFIIVIFLFLTMMKTYFKKPSSNDPTATQVTPGNYDSVLSSMKTQINNATAKESARTNEIQQ